jgi:hypothetical protein
MSNFKNTLGPSVRKAVNEERQVALSSADECVFIGTDYYHYTVEVQLSLQPLYACGVTF